LYQISLIVLKKNPDLTIFTSLLAFAIITRIDLLSKYWILEVSTPLVGELEPKMKPMCVYWVG